jgi:hypothetical protein
MPNQLNSGELITNIQANLADNNAGLISAFDVRSNMEDIAFSINKVIASGETEVEFPFFNAVKISKVDSLSPTAGADHGDLIIESGIFFPNAEDATKQTQRQTEPWLGEEGINHGSLQNLASDTHLQYYNRLGVDAARGNAFLGNVATDQNWINTSGIAGVGFQFVQTNPTATEQDINVSGNLRFMRDNSIIPNTAKGMAKAWCNFDASGEIGNAPVIRSWHGIESIQRLAQGHLKITFSSGVFSGNQYVAIGTSNATNAAGSREDLSVNTVGLVMREGNDGPDDSVTKRTITYVIRTETGDYADSEICDFVAYGYSPSETSGTPPTMIGL